MNIVVAVMTLGLVFFPWAIRAQENVVLAEVERVAMFRVPPTVERREDGEISVTMSTSCGVSEIDLIIHERITGDIQASHISVREPLGELCAPPEMGLLPHRYVVPLGEGGTTLAGTPLPLYETCSGGWAAPPWIADDTAQQQAMIRDVELKLEGAAPLIDAELARQKGYRASWLEILEESPDDVYSYLKLRQGIPYEVLREYIQSRGWIESQLPRGQ